MRPLDESSVTAVRANENHHNTVSIGDLSKRASPLHVGHLLASTNERHGLMALPRLGQISDCRSHGFKEVWKRSSEKPRGGCRAICGTAIEVMQDGPHLVPLLREPPLMVMSLRQSAVAAFYS